MTATIKKILVIQLQQIGDVLLSTAICASLKRTYPEVLVDYLVADFAEGIVRGHPDIHEVVVYEKNKGFAYNLRFFRQLRQRHYDVVIDILCKPRSGLMGLFSGAKKRISFDKKGRQFFYTDRVKGSLGLKVHTIDHRLTLLQPLGQEVVVDKTVRIHLEEELVAATKKKFCAKGLTDGVLKIVFGVASRRSFKVWPQEYFLQVIDHCIQKYQAQIIFFYNAKEKDLCLETRQKVSKPDHVHVDFLGSIRDLAAVFKCCDLFVGNDSGPRHIAEAVETPTFAIYSPSSSKYNWNTQGNPRYQSIDLQDALQLSDDAFAQMLADANKENAEEFMRKISPEFVIARVDAMIENVLGFKPAYE